MTYQLLNSSTTDITQLVSKATWSGSLTEAARKLELSIVASPTDKYLPKVAIECGDMLKMFDDSGNELFRGYVFLRDRSYSSNEISITAYDGLVYLLKSKGTYNVKKMTAEAMTAKLLNEFSIPAGALAKTGISQSRIFDGVSIYEIIMTLYSKAAKQNGKKYKAVMQAGSLSVIEFGAVYSATVLNQITDSSYGESLENMVNRVKVYDDKQKYIKTIENAANVKKYGLLQDTYNKEKDKDASTVAKSMLTSIEQTASVESLGDLSCTTGKAVKVSETYTGLTGIFWVNSDTHSFENAQHTMSLELSFKVMMDEKEAGS